MKADTWLGYEGNEKLMKNWGMRERHISSLSADQSNLGYSLSKKEIVVAHDDFLQLSIMMLKKEKRKMFQAHSCILNPY
jgi:hypothetical protein